MAYVGDKHYGTMGAQSVLSTSNLFQGFWSHVDVTKDGFPSGNDPFYLGVVNEGALEVSREDTEFLGTTFPQVVELVTPTQVGMKFSGEIAELMKSNLHLAIDGNVEDTTNFIYPGATCSDTFVSVRALRERCDGFIMDMVIWKARNAAPLTIGGGTEVISSPIEFNALDDRGGSMGGSSSAPLGYLYAPDPQGSVAPDAAVNNPDFANPVDANG
jgi:hypothetical protein